MFTKVQERNYETYQIVKEFGRDKYFLEFMIDSDKVFVYLSSGNKRKHKEVFEDKDYKSSGGLKALFWARDSMFDFIKFRPTKYTVVGWTNSRRKRVYKRALCDYGFYEGVVEKVPCLLKKNYD